MVSRKNRKSDTVMVNGNATNGTIKLKNECRDEMNEEPMEIVNTKQLNGSTTPTAKKVVQKSQSTPGSGKKGNQGQSLGDKRKAQVVQAQTTVDPMDSAKVSSHPTSSNDSMVVLLTQGLMAHDDQKLDAVLQTTDINVVQATLSEIQVTHIVPLLKAIETRLRNRRALDIRSWIRWTQSIFTMHMSYLSSLKTLERDVGGLLEWMRSRTGHASRLLALHGKMSILAEHIEKRSNKQLEPLPQPLIVFNADDVDTSEDEDLDSNVDDDSGGSSAEEEWWDDGTLAPGGDDDIEESESSDEDETPVNRKRKNSDGTGDDSDDDGNNGDDDDGNEDDDDGDSDDEMDES